VIIGHSERRQYFQETDEQVARKLAAVHTSGLKAIVCIGETLEQREKGETAEVIETQLRGGLAGRTADEMNQVLLAYEPVWAIGTGKAATAADAAEVIGQVIRTTIADLFGQEVAQSLRVLYGGSVKPENADDYFELETIDGALVGGASLKADLFSAIAKAAQRNL
jgi:triosephosphate isomerase